MQSENLFAKYYFEKYVQAVCSATLAYGGVTSRIDTHQFLAEVDAWAVPKYPDRTVILLPDAELAREIATFIHTNEVYLIDPGCWLGTWIDPRSGNCYLDITAVYPCLEEAMQVATTVSLTARRRIVALYNFKREQPVYLVES